MSKYILGIDVGTTGTKSMLFSEDGMLAAKAYQGYEMITPQPEWSEQRADDWWNAVVSTVRSAVSQVGPDIGRNVAGISLSLQGGTFVPVDHDMRPLKNAVVWNDCRCADERDRFIEEFGGREPMYQKTGWKLCRGLLPLNIRRLKDKEPEVFAKSAMFMSVPDFISYKMTGIAAIDVSDTGINQTGNVRLGAYDDDILRFAGIDSSQLPLIVRSGEPIGHLTEAAAAELGLSTDCVLYAGAHDQYAVALGAGATHPGDILIGSGTCWVITALDSAPDFESGIPQSVSAVPGLWGSCWSLSSGGICLDWFRRNIALCDDERTIDYQRLNVEIPQRKAAENGLFFFPFNAHGENYREFSKASFIGMDLSHDRFDMARAIMEGVAFEIKGMLERFKADPADAGYIKLSGGAAKSKAWCQILADILGLPVRIPKVADLACVGAAMLAGVGCGIFKDLSDGYSHLDVDGYVLMPDLEAVSMYEKAYDKYRQNASILGMIYK